MTPRNIGARSGALCAMFLTALAGVPLAAGCQSGAVRPAFVPSVSVSDLEEGWLLVEARVCKSVDGSDVECVDLQDTVWSEEFDELMVVARAGYEVPAFRTRAECEQGQVVRSDVQGKRVTMRVESLRCKKVSGVYTGGGGWYPVAIRECRTEAAGRFCDEWFVLPADAMGTLLRAGLNAATYGSRASCAESVVYRIHTFMNADVDVRCRRF